MQAYFLYNGYLFKHKTINTSRFFYEKIFMQLKKINIPALPLNTCLAVLI